MWVLIETGSTRVALEMAKLYPKQYRVVWTDAGKLLTFQYAANPHDLEVIRKVAAA
jgi:hypothetical protein